MRPAIVRHVIVAALALAFTAGAEHRASAQSGAGISAPGTGEDMPPAPAQGSAPLPAPDKNGSDKAPAVAPPSDPVAAAKAAAQQLARQAVGAVASTQGSATVTRSGSVTPLKSSDYLFAGDILQTGPDGQLGLTFDDGTTFNLGPNARMEVNDFSYRKGAKNNSARFTVSRGSVGFASSQIAKSGTMRIDTPTQSLGGPGATGLIEIADASADAGSISPEIIKLYPDPKGRTGRIDIYKAGNDAAVAELTKPNTSYSDKSQVAKIPPDQVKQDRPAVKRVYATQVAGVKFISERHVLLGLPAPVIPGVAIPAVAVPLAVAIPGLAIAAPRARRGRGPAFVIPGLRF